MNTADANFGNTGWKVTGRQGHANVQQTEHDPRVFMEAVESSSIATIITTTEPAIIYVNPAWEKLTGFRKEEAIGKNPRIAQSGKTPPAMYAQMWDAILKNTQYQTDAITNRRKDGTEYNAELRVFPVAEKGVVKYFVGHEIDITFRLRAERAKTEFISIVSHQLQSPITSFHLGLELFQEEKGLTDAQHEFIAKLQKTATQMQETMDIILALSRIQEGRVLVSSKLIEVQELLRKLEAEFRMQAEAKRQQLVFPKERNLSFLGDAAILHEILANLLSNAIKYTPSGGTITLAMSDERNAMSFSVQDTGMGIPADQQPRLFTKFFRATNVIEKVPNGTGLGLHLVHELAQMLNGRISFVSKENVGTTFTLHIPKNQTSAVLD
jgi:PAS domain S-box-containing protein